ncbi:hypothetical protein [Clostridium sp. DL1XJH146]
MEEWWSALVGLEKFFWVLAIPSTCLFLIQMALLLIGVDFGEDMPDSFDVDGIGDFDMDVDELDISSDTDVQASNIPLKLITFRNVVIFSTIFSWTGITALDSGIRALQAILIAIVVALTVVAILTGVLRALLKLQESGNISLRNAMGKSGSVYLTIPEREKGTGKIEITFQGKYQIVEAITKEESIKTGESIIVTGIKNNNLIVKKIDGGN